MFDKPVDYVMVYIPGGGSSIDNVLFYTTVGGFPLTFSIVLHTFLWFTDNFRNMFTCL